jgi:hypothetical protein
MDDEFMYKMDMLRQMMDEPIKVNSAFRCNIHDSKIGGKGEHSLGKGIDIHVPNATYRFKLVDFAIKLGIGRIGIANTFVHLGSADQVDGYPTPRIWTY